MVVRDLKENTIEIDGVVLILAQDVEALQLMEQSPSPSPAPSTEGQQHQRRSQQPATKKVSPRRRTQEAREDSVTRALANSNRLGVRKYRRWENQCFLKALAKKLQDSDGGPIREPLAPTSTSALTELFSDPDAMRTWLEFQTQDLAAQEKLLRQHERPSGGEKDRDAAQAPEQRFLLIDRHIRKVLRRSNLPLGRMEELEEEVLCAFEQDPSARLTKDCENGFERLLLHGIAQYMHLTSESHTVRGQRVTTVRNTKDTFERPALTLTQFLEKPDA